MIARRHIPNLLTFARVAAVPVCLAIMLLDPAWEVMALFWIFIAASLTDFLDGYLARRWQVVSPVGAMLDPIADKLLVALMLVYVLTLYGSALMLPVVVILLRELYVSGLREFLAGRQVTLPVSQGGKWKTAVQMVAIAALLGRYAFNPPHQLNFPCSIVREASGALSTSCSGQPFLLRAADFAGLPLLYAAAALAFISAALYTKASWKSLR